MKFYFANQTSKALLGRQTQVEIEQRTGLELDNPFFNADGTPTPEMAQRLAGQKVTVNNHEITAVDLNKVREADGVLVFLSEDCLCIGTIWELATAVMCWGRPAYIISFIQKVKGHPFPDHFGIPVFTSVDEFVEFANKKWKLNTQPK